MNAEDKPVRDDPKSPYEKLRRAYKENRGTNLTAADVDILMSDTAINDAVYQTYAGE